jgi:hypothetical protein
MMRNGVVFGQQMQVPHMEDTEYSLLRTPISSEAEGGAMHPDDAKAGGNNLKLGWQILGHFGHIKPKRNLPTPTVADQFTDGLKSAQQSDGSLHSVSLAQIVHRSDLFTTQDDEKINDDDEKNWGQFSSSIKRWESIINRKAPAPTENTGKNGAPRLSAKFTEWMMGLEEGHITNPEIGLTRNEALKACGNGVVPQQASLALRYLLKGKTWLQ